jgi:hypothetical protein
MVGNELEVQVLLGNNHPVMVKPYSYQGKVLVDIPLNNHYLTPNKPIKLSTNGKGVQEYNVYSWSLTGNKPEVTIRWA